MQPFTLLAWNLTKKCHLLCVRPFIDYKKSRGFLLCFYWFSAQANFSTAIYFKMSQKWPNIDHQASLTKLQSILMIHSFTQKCSQSNVQQPLSVPRNSGRCWQVAIVHRPFIFKMVNLEHQISGRYRQVVDIQRWSLAQVRLNKKSYSWL